MYNLPVLFMEIKVSLKRSIFFVNYLANERKHTITIFFVSFGRLELIIIINILYTKAAILVKTETRKKIHRFE